MVIAMAIIAALFFLLMDQILKFFRIGFESEFLNENGIVQSHSSFENKVAQIIKDEAEKAKISEKFEEIIVPTHDITEVKEVKEYKKKKYFPGYVLIKRDG